MIYMFYSKDYKKGSFEIEFENRFDVVDYVYEHIDELQKFSVKETGEIFGYAVEISDKTNKPISILYRHKITQWIWIDF